MKNISNILLLIISLLFIVTAIAIIPMASTIQNLAFVVMVLVIVGLFGVIRFIAYMTAMNCHKRQSKVCVIAQTFFVYRSKFTNRIKRGYY